MERYNRLLRAVCTALTAALMAGCTAFLAVRAPGFEISWLPVYFIAAAAAALVLLGRRGLPWMIGCIAAGFVLLHFLSKKRKYDGQIALGYVAWYGLGRAMIEGLRVDSLYWGDFRVSQLLAAVSCFAAVVALVILSFKPHSSKDLFVNRVAEQAETTEEETQAETE